MTGTNKNGKGKKSNEKSQDMPGGGATGGNETLPPNNTPATESELTPESIRTLIWEVLGEYSAHYRDRKKVKESQDVFKQEIEAKWAEFKENESHRRLLNDTDILDLKRRVSKLPPDGNLTPFFAEKTLKESLNLTQQNTIGDDSINS